MNLRHGMRQSGVSLVVVMTAVLLLFALSPTETALASMTTTRAASAGPLRSCSPRQATRILTSDNSPGSSACAQAQPGVTVNRAGLPAHVTEGGTGGSFTVALTSVPSSPVIITPSSDADQVTLSPASLTFQPDGTALTPRTVTVSITDNGLSDGTRAQQITFGTATSDAQYMGLTISPVAVSIVDDEGLPVISLADVTGAEPATAGGTSTVTMTATVSPPSARPANVWYGAGAGTARGGTSCGPGVDYQTVNGRSTLGAGETSMSFQVTICGDDDIEADETFLVYFGGQFAGAWIESQGNATVTVANTGGLLAAGGADTYAVGNGTALSVSAPGLLANDAASGPLGSLQAQVVAGPAAGRLTLNPDGSFVYAPRADYAGTDSFTYRVSNGMHVSRPTTVSILVTPSRCGPRPRIQSQPESGGGHLRATIQATPLGTGEANPLTEITFGRLQNAQVTLGGQPVTSGQVVTLPANSVSAVLIVRRVTPGQATMVPLAVKDGCGSWSTFVGGGAAAGF